MPEQLMYITWNIESGALSRIAGHPIPNSIAVPLSAIARVEAGEESAQKYRVQYNTRLKKYELIRNEDYELITHNINDSIYIINPNVSDTPDLIITQDVKDQTWTFVITEPQKIDKLLWFSVVSKDNPNILIRSFKFNLQDLSEDGLTFKFINTRGESAKEVSICTNRIFSEYNFIQAGYESN